MVEKEGFNVGEITKFGLLTLCVLFWRLAQMGMPKNNNEKVNETPFAEPRQCFYLAFRFHSRFVLILGSSTGAICSIGVGENFLMPQHCGWFVLYPILFQMDQSYRVAIYYSWLEVGCTEQENIC
jgi:hypothetical protein